MEIFNGQIQKLKKESGELKEQVKQKTIGYILAALGLVAGLAWNEAIKALIDYFFPPNQNGLIVKFVYAILMTIVVVIITVYLIRLTSKEKGKNQ